MSIKAYPKPVMTFVELVCFEDMFNFLPVVTEIARVAASLSLPSILPADEVTETVPPEEGSESTSRELLLLAADRPG
jgi:hypothetical protein